MNVVPTPFYVDLTEILKQYLVINFMFLIVFAIVMGLIISFTKKDKKK